MVLKRFCLVLPLMCVRFTQATPEGQRVVGTFRHPSPMTAPGASARALLGGDQKPERPSPRGGRPARG